MWYSRWTGSKIFIRDKHRLWYLTPNLKNSFLNVILMSTKFPFTYLFFTDRHDHVGFYSAHFCVFTFRSPVPPAAGSKTSLPTDCNQSNYFQALFSPKCAFLLFYIYSYGLSIFLLIVLISHFCHLLVLSYYLCFIPVLISLYMWHVTMTIKALFYSILFLSTSINFPNINLWFEITKILNTKINQCFIRNGSKIILIMHPNEWMKNIRSWGLLMSQGLWENTVQFLMQLQLFF